MTLTMVDLIQIVKGFLHRTSHLSKSFPEVQETMFIN